MVAQVFDSLTYYLEQSNAGCIFVRGIGVGEMHPDVTQTGSPQERIDDRVRQDISVRMSFQPSMMVYLDSPENELSSVRKSVGIKSLAYPHAQSPTPFQLGQA